MLLTLSLQSDPENNIKATDLSYLLHKSPDRIHSFSLSHNTAHVFYPQCDEDQCQVALLLEVDAISLVRTFRGPMSSKQLTHYLNDRPYTANSFMSVALARAFRSAMGGRSKEREALVDCKLPLTVHIPVLPCRGGQPVLEKLFSPLGYEISAEPIALDNQFSEWGHSHYYQVTLKNKCRLVDLLSHLYVLMPVLDNDKHYWVSADEIEKLLLRGGDWLAQHPAKEFISLRYLKHKKHYAQIALAALAPEQIDAEEKADQAEAELEKPLTLNQQRQQKVIDTLLAHQVQSILDLGCGEGKLMKLLASHAQFKSIVGVDVSSQALDRASSRLRLEHWSERQQHRIQLWHGSAFYSDSRWTSFEAICCIEMIEHMDEDRLEAFIENVFNIAQPKLIIITTPNQEYNVVFGLSENQRRHSDHRFEWTRTEFTTWCQCIVDNYDYQVTLEGIGTNDKNYGHPTQMAVFTRST